MGALVVNPVRTCVETCPRTVDDYLIFFFSFNLRILKNRSECVKCRSKAVMFL